MTRSQKIVVQKLQAHWEEKLRDDPDVPSMNGSNLPNV